MWGTALVDEPLTDIAVGALARRCLASDLGFLSSALRAIGEQVVRDSVRP